MPVSTPNYLAIDPTTGLVTAIFSGGVIIDAASDTVYPAVTDHAVSWRNALEVIIAQVVGFAVASGAIDGIEVGTQASSPARTSRVALRARGGANAQQATVEIDANDTGLGPGYGARITLFAGALSRILFRGDGASDFVQKAAGSGNNLTIQWTGAALNFFVDGVLVRSL